MEDKPKFNKLSALVGEEIKIKDVEGFMWKMWDNDKKKMEVSPVFMSGYRKVYQVVTDKGKLDMSQSQLGNMLEAANVRGKADIIGKTFHIKSNNKQGLEIRYYLNLVEPMPAEVEDGEEAPW